MKKELLAPAGNMECLKMAVLAGADAVYFGGKAFGARAFSNNFTNEEIKEAITFCHLYGVKAYITVNTLVYDDEIEDFIEYITFLYNEDADALIMQDIGMMFLVHNRFPDIEIHASTQVHNYNKEGLKLLKELGVSRIVLDRELSLEEINNLPNDLLKEVFIHGALCLSYSGCCYFSSIVGGRSGNRGECAGSCRLPYSLYEDDKKIIDNKFLLSSKELNTSSYFKELLESSCTSFKIEGRMKSPEYVFYVTRFYKEIIDHYLLTKEIVIPSIYNIKVLFNRGFTKGHLFNEVDDELLNIESPAHQGLSLGKIIEITTKKIKIFLQEDLHQFDGIRFAEENKGMIVNFLYDKYDNLINKAFRGDVIYLDNKVGLINTKTVLKTSDSLLLTKINSFPLRKIPIDITFKATLKNASITLKEGDKEINITREIVTEAKTFPITKETVSKQLLKLGDSVYCNNNLKIIIDDNLFINVKDLNALRRDAILLLNEKRLEKHLRTIKPFSNKLLSIENSFEKSFLITSSHPLEQKKNVLCFDNKTNLILNRTNKTFDYHNKTIFIEELGGVNIAHSNDAYSSYTLNVTNAYSVYYLLLKGVKKVCLSIEMNDKQIDTLINNFKTLFGIIPPIMVFVYGRIALMIMKYNLVRGSLKDDKYNFSNHSYFLEDRKSAKYPLHLSLNETIIYNSLITNYLLKIKDYEKRNITSFYIDLSLVKEEEYKEIISKLGVNENSK